MTVEECLDIDNATLELANEVFGEIQFSQEDIDLIRADMTCWESVVDEG
jgi:hypothetical protein